MQNAECKMQNAKKTAAPFHISPHPVFHVTADMSKAITP
jgi:hypothetical protein